MSLSSIPAAGPASRDAAGDEAEIVTLADVMAAGRRLEGVARQTPLERSDPLSELAGTDVWLKLEGLQRTGSFKVRGAYNRLAAMTQAERARGVVTASAGNHGLGVALAGRLHGIRPTVYVPESAALTKRRRIARMGAELRTVSGGYDDAHHAAVAFAEETGGRFVNAFSDPLVVAGQGTVGLEILRALPEVRTIVCPVGGGGLIGGIGTVMRAAGPTIRMIGVQTETTAAMHASLAAGALVCPAQGPTLCEGLEGETDAPSLALAQRVVDEVVLVSEASVPRAMRWLYEEEGVVAEGSAAVAVAALLEGVLRGLAGPVAVVLSGSNVDSARLASVLGGSSG